MYILRGFSADRKSKVFIQAKCLEEVIEEMKRKLSLPDENYLVYQEDGTLIDDELVFLALCEEAKEAKSKLGVLLLPEDTQWSTDSTSGSFDSTSGSSQTELGSSPARSPSSDSGLSVATTVSTGFPISKISDFLDPLLEMAGNSRPRDYSTQKNHAVKEAFHAIGNYMLYNLRDFSKPTAKRLAKSVFEYGNGKYAALFNIIISDEVVETGLSTFTQQIYAYVQANKGDHRKRKRRQGSEPTSDIEDDPLTPPTPSKQDEYGCVAFEAPLPEGETVESQEDKRLTALTAEPGSAQACELMAATYSSQRAEINRGKPFLINLPFIIARWPLLQDCNHLIGHAALLMGKDVRGVWLKQVSEKWPNLFEFFSDFFKTSTPRVASDVQNCMLALLLQAEQLDNSRAVVAKCSSVFPLVVGFMADRASAIFVVIKGDSTENEIIGAAKDNEGYPLLVCKGDSILDPSASYHVVLVGKQAILANNAVEGFLLLVLSYYIFNCAYHPAAHSSLEFFQRFFLQVNPPGNKRAKQKRTADNIDSKVKQLSKKLNSFMSRQWVL